MMEETRKLAHIEVIEDIYPIEKADKIEVAKVLGWECVVKKDEFKKGQLVVYVEVDSIMPEKPEYEFLRERKYRVKTIKLRGQVSQGLVLPMSVLPDKSIKLIDGYANRGKDVTELLGITKYLTPSERNEVEEQERRIARDKNKLRKFMMRYSWFRKLFLSRTKKSGFPYWVSKTDEERIQNMPNVLTQFADTEVYATEKIDYQSVTFTGKMVPKFGGWLGRVLPIKEYKFVVCSRNMTNNDKKSLYWKIAEKYGIENILKQEPYLTIQGEQGDTKIQGNKYGITEPRLWVFNVINHETGYHYNYAEIVEFCFMYGLEPVPFLGSGSLSSFGTTVPEIVEYSKGKSVLADIPREGVVFRAVKNGQKLLSFKAINPEFLLKYD